MERGRHAPRDLAAHPRVGPRQPECERGARRGKAQLAHRRPARRAHHLRRRGPRRPLRGHRDPARYAAVRLSPRRPLRPRPSAGAYGRGRERAELGAGQRSPPSSAGASARPGGRVGRGLHRRAGRRGGVGQPSRGFDVQLSGRPHGVSGDRGSPGPAPDRRRAIQGRRRSAVRSRKRLPARSAAQHVHARAPRIGRAVPGRPCSRARPLGRRRALGVPFHENLRQIGLAVGRAGRGGRLFRPRTEGGGRESGRRAGRRRAGDPGRNPLCTQRHRPPFR